MLKNLASDNSSQTQTITTTEKMVMMMLLEIYIYHKLFILLEPRVEIKAG